METAPGLKTRIRQVAGGRANLRLGDRESWPVRAGNEVVIQPSRCMTDPTAIPVALSVGHVS